MNKPSKYAIKFLRWFCREDYIDEIEGDLIEIYEYQSDESQNQAGWTLFWNVLLHFRPDYIRAFENNIRLIHYGMLKNYFLIAWRSMLKQKLYSFINIGGLAVGMTCFILISLYIQHELSYDQFFSNSDQVYRIYQQQAGNHYLGSDYFAVTPVGLSSALEQEFPEVNHAAAFQQRSALLGLDDEHYNEKGLIAEPDFFEVLPFHLVEGNPNTSISQPKSIVLTQSLAHKIFKSEDAMGKTITYQNGDEFTVTGIVADPPANSSIQFSFIASILSDSDYIYNLKREKWNNNSIQTFFTLHPNVDPKLVQAKLPELYEKYTGNDENDPYKDAYYAQALADLHLESKANFDIGTKGNIQYIVIFSVFSVLILLLACINYMNLAIARSISRTKEVGLRKVIGAKRNQLIWQFLGESILVAFFALLLAITLAHYTVPLFADLLESTIQLDFGENFYLLPGLVGLALFVGILSGSYPAFVMSSLKPIQVLQGKLSAKFSGNNLQRFLLIAQYATSITLLICSIGIFHQFQFIQNKELGYNKEQILTIPLSYRDKNLLDNIEVLKNQWNQNPHVVAVTNSGSLPTNISSSTIINDESENPQDKEVAIYENRVGYDFLDVFGIELIAGRNFSKDYSTDLEEGYIINETAAKALGWTPEEAIGKQFDHQGPETVIGVVKDFHMHSMHMAIEPLMLHLETYIPLYLSAKVLPNELPETISFLEKSFKSYSPYPFEYAFLDERFDQLYKQDVRLGEIFGFFTFLSILIASLGLFGMAAINVGKRSKEIGIRKVLGATVASILRMLSIDFLKMVLVGFVIAVPLGWYIMNRWLEAFAYRIEIQWWIFALGGGLAVLLALLTVSSQTFKAARVDPVEFLRNE